MGQASSTQTRPADSDRGRRRRLLGLYGKRRRPLADDTDGLQEEGSQSLLGSRSVHALGSSARPRPRSLFGAPAAIFQRQISARSSPVQQPAEPDEPPASTQDAVVYEHEERPLMSVEDIRISDAPISNITALPMPRSPSVIARISSRLSQRYSSIELGPAESDENNSTWQLPSPVSLQDGWQSDGSVHARSGRSMLGTLTDPVPSSSTLRLRRRSAALGREPMLDDTSQLGPISALHSSAQGGSTPAESTVHSSTRLSRVRRSLTGPLEALLNRPSSVRQERHAPQPDFSSPSQAPEQDSSEDTEYLLPPINISTALDFEQLPSNSSTETRVRAGTPIPEPSFRSSWSDRWSPRTPTIRREPRRVPNLLRGRSNRLIRRDEEIPLSRILQLAAATIAAQLSGNTDAMANLEAVGDDHFDGGLTNFMDDLSNAAGSNQTAHEGSSTEAQTPPPPLNFWRAFRFMGTSSTPRTNNSRDEPEQRTVTLVVVGVRSVLSSNLQREVFEGQEANIDTLFSDAPSPALSSTNRTRRPRSFLRSVSGRSSLGAYSRRSSISTHDPFPAQYESQRHSLAGPHRSPSDRPNGAASMTADNEADSSLRLPLQSSASIEIPPPAISPSSSYQNSRPLSTASDFNGPLEAFVSESSSHAGDIGPGVNLSAEPHPQGPVVHSYGDQPFDRETIPEPPPVRRRRRSDSELARAENLASHRNGTIDPDGGPLMGRSWLIYVVGTNLPADHPIFQVPSLLSDNPTYEDMVTLSNLLGPVRPPVAHPDDIERAGGLFKLVAAEEEEEDDNNNNAVASDAQQRLRAMPLEGTPGPSFRLAAADTCLVCLSGFAAAEELRELAKCKHRFHRACIDEWLTTGRNSCPLCRAAGVPRDEAAASPTAPAQAPAAS